MGYAHETTVTFYRKPTTKKHSRPSETPIKFQMALLSCVNRATRSSQVHCHIVNQARVAQAGGGQNHQILIARMRDIQAVGMAHFDIVHHPARSGQIGFSLCFLYRISQIAALNGIGHRPQFAIQMRCFGALGFAQILIAAG